MASMTEEERFFHEVRLLQRRTKCSNYVCQQFIRVFKQHVDIEANTSIAAFDKKGRRAAGVDYLVLDGCPKCNKHVYTPGDTRDNCPHEKNDGTICGHPRFDPSGKPFEVSFVLCLFVFACTTAYYIDVYFTAFCHRERSTSRCINVCEHYFVSRTSKVCWNTSTVVQRPRIQT